MKDFLNALSFLTILPVYQDGDDKLYRAFRFFPIVGALIGVVTYLIYHQLALFLPTSLATVISVFVYHIINGGLHLDGFADLFDAYFGAKKNKERFKEILKDSRVGVMGVFGLIFYFSTIFFALLNIKLDLTFFVALGIYGRLAIVIIGFLSQPLFEEGLGSYFIKNLTKYELFIAIITSFILVLFLGKLFVFFLFVSILWSYLFRVFSNQYLGGVSGDIMGAGCILTELIYVIGWRAFLP
ncbi:MAG: adenosylcobinamide-GDP ribazoletransferase [Proteobacteria bacterium]|nr:adenosylcobinamide-GDP ribazoletransferase [Pseudomonadota bacterium]